MKFSHSLVLTSVHNISPKGIYKSLFSTYHTAIFKGWKGNEMRAKGRNQGRFMALSGYKKIHGPLNGRYPLLIVDPSGLPVFPLCEWYRRKKEFEPGRTPDTYLDMALPYFSFLQQKGYSWNAPPNRIRAYLVEFLRMDVGCQVGPAPEEGYHVETTGTSPLSKSSLGVLLAALTSLYDVLADAHCYPFQNPLRSERLTTLKQEHLRQVKNAGAPDHAGIRSESHLETNLAYPTSFFRQKRGKAWEPNVVMEPDDVMLHIRQTIDFMIKRATFQRDKVVLLLLRQTGARLSEILELTAGGYRKAAHHERALVKNKGSHGREEKAIYFTSVIERELMKYIQTERAEHDSLGRKRLEELDDANPIFLTEQGTPYDRNAFYYHWKRLFEAAQQNTKKQDRVQFSPHDIRHLHVTANLTKIKRKAQGDQYLEAELKEGFRLLMGWRSQETMDIYTHTYNKRKALLEIVLKDEDEIEENMSPIQPAPQKMKVNNFIHVPSTDDSRTTISPSVNDENLDWYEE